MDKLAALRAFVEVVDAAGFAAAARRLGQSRSAVNRLVLNLEAGLGTQLLTRTTRRVSPTPSGAAFHARAKAILAELEEAEWSLVEREGEARGELRINAPMSFGTMHLAPLLGAFMARHPAIRIELELDDRFVDIVEGGYDLAVRIAAPREDTTFVDHRIAEIRRVVCAAPDYLARAGTPRHPRDLRAHSCLHYGNLSSGHFWPLESADGTQGVHVTGVLSANNAESLRDAALAGLGVALLPTFVVGRELQEGRLVTILEDFRPPELWLAVIYPPRRHLSRRIRLFTDFMIERFGGRPYWDLVD